MHHIAGHQFPRGLAPFLIPASACSDQEHLSAALVGVMDMPVIAAARLESHIAYDDLVKGKHIQIALAVKILSIVDIFSPHREKAGLPDSFQINFIACKRVLH